MKKTVTIKLDHKDHRLILTKLPDNPCQKCDLGIACCGCPKGSEYYKLIKPSKDAGVYEYLVKFNNLIKYKHQIADLTKEYTKIMDELISIGIEPSEIYFAINK